MADQTVEDKVRGVVNWVDSAIEKRRWTDEEIDEKFALRSADEIVQDGHTCYMNPCLDYTLVMLDALKTAGFETTLVIEELKDPSYSHNRVHFAIEFSDGIEKRYIEFSTFNKVVFGKGDYVNSKEGIERVGLITISGNYMGPDKNILEILGISSRDGAEALFDGFSFAPQLALLKKSNSDRTYDAYIRRLGDRTNLSLDAYPLS